MMINLLGGVFLEEFTWLTSEYVHAKYRCNLSMLVYIFGPSLLQGPSPVVYKPCDWSRSRRWSKFKFTLDLEGSRDQRKYEWMKCPHGAFHRNVRIMFHGLQYTVLRYVHRKRWVKHKTRGSGNRLSCRWLLGILHYHGDPNPSICYGPSTWSTFTSHRGWGPFDYKFEFVFPKVQCLDGYRRPLDFHEYNFWFVSKAAISLFIVGTTNRDLYTPSFSHWLRSEWRSHFVLQNLL